MPERRLLGSSKHLGPDFIPEAVDPKGSFKGAFTGSCRGSFMVTLSFQEAEASVSDFSPSGPLRWVNLSWGPYLCVPRDSNIP